MGKMINSILCVFNYNLKLVSGFHTSAVHNMHKFFSGMSCLRGGHIYLSSFTAKRTWPSTPNQCFNQDKHKIKFQHPKVAKLIIDDDLVALNTYFY